MTWKSAYQLADGIRYAPTDTHEYYKFEIRKTPLGVGLFTIEDLWKNSVVIQDGGVVLTSHKDIPSQYYGYQVVIGEGLLLSPSDPDRMTKPCFINHSCSPNLARIGALTYVATRFIKAGEELTLDYAPLTAGLTHWTLKCSCASSECRKIITGNDWQNAATAKKLWPQWLPFIQKEIIRQRILSAAELP